MPLTDNIEDVTSAVKARIETDKGTLGFAEDAIYYGDQSKIHKTPAIAVESGSMTSELAGIGGKGVVEITFTVFLMLYISKIDSVQSNRKDADALADAVRDSLHTDITLGGLVVHGYVTSIEPGYATRSGELMRSARITWRGLSKMMIV